MTQKLSFIHPEAKIAENVTVDAFSSIAADVEIGENTWIGSNVTIMDGARIGKNCKIFPGAVISAIPQDLKFVGEKTFAFIGDNTSVRECVTVNRGTKSKGKTVVGNDCLLMAYVHVAHDCVVKNRVILGNSVQVAGEVEIDDWAIVSGLSAIHQFVKIGKHTMISGGSLVRQDVPPFITAAHEPLAFVGLNTIGLKRRDFTNEQITQIQDIYRIIFQSGLNLSNALETVEQEIPNSEFKTEVLNFITTSERGILKGFNPKK